MYLYTLRLFVKPLVKQAARALNLHAMSTTTAPVVSTVGTSDTTTPALSIGSRVVADLFVVISILCSFFSQLS